MKGSCTGDAVGVLSLPCQALVQTLAELLSSYIYRHLHHLQP